jgi:hypothetical protein
MKTRKLLYPLILTAITILGSNCAIFKKSADNGPFTLRYKFSPGQEFVITSDVKSDFVTEQMGQSMSVDMGSKTVLGFNVLAQEEDTYRIEMEFADMEQTVDSPMGGGETDYSELMGKKTSFSVGGTGETDNLEGFAELPTITNASGETINGEMYEQVVGASFSKLPEEPVKPGDSWEDSFSRDMPYGGGTLKTEAQYTYLVSEKVNIDGEDCLRIEITGSGKTSGTFEQQGMLIGIDRTSKSTGHMFFAYKKGMYLSSEVISKTDGIVNIESMGMEIPQTINSTTKTTVEFK